MASPPRRHFHPRRHGRFAALGAVLLVALSALPPKALAGQAREVWRLVWEDDFSGKSLDRKKWNVESGYGLWGNGELEEYRSRGTLSLVDGVLVIEARKAGDRYLSARINTKGKFAFSHGRLEARMRLPRGSGLWPALWMMGSDVDEVGHPRCGEIDIVEMVGGSGAGLSDRVVYSSLHRPDPEAPSGLYSRTGSFEAEEALAAGFHVFSMDRDEKAIRASRSMAGSTSASNSQAKRMPSSGRTISSSSTWP